MLPRAALSVTSIRFLDILGTGIKARTLATSLAIAKYLADTAPMPSGPSDDIQQIYNTNVSIGVGIKLSLLNELVAVDVNTILDLTNHLYKARYYAVYPPMRAMFLSPDTFVTDFFGLSDAI